MLNIEVNRIGELIEKSPNKMNLMFIGDTGVGKTTCLENYCEEKGIYLKTLILSQIDASECLGIPVQSTRMYNGKEEICLKTAIPEWAFDLAEQENAILFLDEFLCAQPSVMNAFLNFLTQKRVGNIDLSHVRVVAATNIGMYTFEPDQNILSRFCMFYVVNTSFNKYIKNNKIINNYVDENEQEGVLFDKRSLKPRCQEILNMVEDENYISMFYEGYTNDKYMYFCDIESINKAFAMLALNIDNKFLIEDTSLILLANMLKELNPKVKTWDRYIKHRVKDIKFNSDKLLEILNN